MTCSALCCCSPRTPACGSTGRPSASTVAGSPGCEPGSRRFRRRFRRRRGAHTLSDELGVTGPLVNGNWLEKTSIGTIDHVNPATARVNGSVLLCGPQEVDAAVAAAKDAYPQWRAMSPDKRRRILQRIEELMLARVAELGRLTTLELGVPLAVSSALAYLCSRRFGDYAGRGGKTEGGATPPGPGLAPGPPPTP